MFDLIISGGTIIDGTGAPPMPGDVAIKDGRIAAIADRVDGAAKRTIYADGAIVTPGFIDLHSHYDGQVTWDDKLDPSFSNGITTTVIGNCGVGFAPVRQGDVDRMISVMEGVEDIPGVVLKDGVPFNWESFPEYLNVLAEREYAIDVAALIPHAPLRVYVMGQRAVDHERANDGDVERMAGIVREGMKAGAIGFSTGRIEDHLYGDTFEKVPGTYAEHQEIEALARAMGESGTGYVQIVPRGAAGGGMGEFIGREARLQEHRLFETIVRASGGRPLHYSLPQFDSDPEDWRAMLSETARANEQGLPIYAHFASRGFGMLSTLDGYHNWMFRPSYAAIAHLPRAERAARMRDSDFRRAVMSEPDMPPSRGRDMLSIGLATMFTMRARQGYLMTDRALTEPSMDDSVGALADRTGQEPIDIVYDHLTAGDGSNMLAQMMINYSYGNLDHVYEMLDHPKALSSLGDGGAHVKFITDATTLPLHLTFWARDRQRGPTYPLERMVHQITGRNAIAFGFSDRGELKVGKRADINVIDFDRMKIELPVVEHDLPTGGARLQQSASGFVATIVNGIITRENDRDMGARPGRLVRANTLN